MRKIINKIFITVVCLAAASGAYSQLAIVGPTCVVPNTLYTYRVISAWSDTAKLQVCITGGNLSSRDSAAKLSNCTPKNGAPLGGITVIWNTQGVATITATSGKVTKTLNVTVTTPLSAGVISRTSKATAISSDSIAPILSCSDPSGGSCSPVYVNQWQYSSNAVVWQNVQGGNTRVLNIGSKLAESVFYRRMVTETTSGMIAYSDTAAIYVVPAQLWTDSFKLATIDSASSGLNWTRHFDSERTASCLIPAKTFAQLNPIELFASLYARLQFTDRYCAKNEQYFTA